MFTMIGETGLFDITAISKEVEKYALLNYSVVTDVTHKASFNVGDFVLYVFRASAIKQVDDDFIGSNIWVLKFENVLFVYDGSVDMMSCVYHIVGWSMIHGPFKPVSFERKMIAMSPEETKDGS